MSIDPLAIGVCSWSLQVKSIPELKGLDALYPSLDALYQDLHRNPELSNHEEKTAAKMAARLRQVAKAEAAAAGATREPTIFVNPAESAQALYNDPALTERLGNALRRTLGSTNVVASEPVMGSEDFGVFGRTAGVPSEMLRVGAAEPGAFAKAKAAGTTVPGPHNAGFAPDREPTIRAGVAAFTLSVLELLGRPGGSL